MFQLGVIGYGGRIRDMLKEILRTGKAEVVAVCDTNPEYARENADENGVGEYALYSDAKTMLENTPKSIAVIVGCEGGFSPEEVGSAVEAGCHAVTLGKRILRCETAPSVALSMISYQYEL